MKIYIKHDGEQYSYSNKEDFITEVGAEAWDQGFCIDADDFEAAVEFAREMLEYIVIIEE